MKAHIVGGGFGGLAAAAYLIRNAGVAGQDITVYEADEQMGGSFSLGGGRTLSIVTAKSSTGRISA
jgi:oleate hydratase